MSTRLVVETTCMPVQVVGGADQCSNRCRHKGSTSLSSTAAGPEICLLFGLLELKPKTMRTYFRAEACISAERIARELSPQNQTARVLAAEARGRAKGETGEF